MVHNGKVIEGFIVFSDLEGYSTLKEERHIQDFFQHTLKILATKISDELTKSFYHNTWGDAIIAVFTDANDAIRMMLKYRAFFHAHHISEDTRLIPRISGHYGKMYIFADPFIGQTNVIGEAVNQAARIEPVTRSGEIYVTEEFKQKIEGSARHLLEEVDFDPLGRVALAKGYGQVDLYRLRPVVEEKSIIERLIRYGNPKLPMIPKHNRKEPELSPLAAAVMDNETELSIHHKCKGLQGAGQYQKLRLQLDGLLDRPISGLLAFELAKICKEVGFYSKALKFIAAAKAWKTQLGNNSELTFHPYRHDRELLKIEATCRSRLGTQGDYQKAAEILYGLNLNAPDSDTLSMFAAELKRRALWDVDKGLSADFNDLLLETAKDLYIEAFQMDLNSYYPAINAAYLLIMLGERKGKYSRQVQQGKMLARYITSRWMHLQGKDWWADSTFAQAEMLQDQFEVATELMQHALHKHEANISVFELQSTMQQIQTYLKVVHKESEGNGIVAAIEGLLKNVHARAHIDRMEENDRNGLVPEDEQSCEEEMVPAE